MLRSPCDLLFITCFVIATVCGAGGQNCVRGEDFSNGNPVQFTDYSLINTGVHSEPHQYRVISDPSTAFTNGYDHFFDHTIGTAAGQMLFFDASGASSDRIWYQTLSLNSGTTYTLSFWGAAADGFNVPQLFARVDGVDVPGNLVTVSTFWQQLSVMFSVGTSGVHTLSINDRVTDGFGNDGAIDDLLLNGAPFPPAADYNRNGIVDAADYVIWRRMLGQSVSPGSGADGTGSSGIPDGVVDSLDFNLWRAQFGNLAGSGSSLFGVRVPEPASASLLVLSCLGLGMRPQWQYRSAYRALRESFPVGSGSCCKSEERKP